MRFITLCPECNLQYYSDEAETQTQFHCYCGALLKINKAGNHEAAVIRCSSCGAARAEKALSCEFCHSDFTLHERDLLTVCPKCLARVSNQARFCHHCATPIKAQYSAGDKSLLDCPVCDKRSQLYIRQSIVPFFECHLCAGLWLEKNDFETLVSQAKKEASPELCSSEKKLSVVGQEYTNSEIIQTSYYKKCPICKALMQRRNYAAKSGIIVDCCQKHGVWFDGNELELLLQWIEKGGLESSVGAATTPPISISKVDSVVKPDNRNFINDLLGILPSIFDPLD